MLAVLEIQSDDVLLARLRAGDDVAFQALVDRHRPWLVRLCTRLLGHDAHAAEDAAQESLLKLHAAARRDGRPLRVRPWLTVVARNTCVDEQRRRRPELPGELPERIAPGSDPVPLDAALAQAWSSLSGRHREVLYLREVLGFSYKEIGGAMGLSMPATETLVFRARAALRREYERSGGSSFSCVLLGVQLSRLGGDHRRQAGMPDGLSTMATHNGYSGLTARLTHFLSSSVPGCGEQAVAKVLTVAAGVAMAAASMTAGLGPFGDAPSAAAAPAASDVTAILVPVDTTRPVPAAAAPGTPMTTPPAATSATTLKAMLGEAVPADWAPRRPAAGSAAVTTAGQPADVDEAARTRPTPLRGAVEAARPNDRPRLRQTERDAAEPGPIRSILTTRPDVGDRPERPRPLRTLMNEAIPTALDGLPLDGPPLDGPPVESGPAEPVPAEPGPTDPTAPTGPVEAPPAAEPSRPSVRETVQPAMATFAGDESALLQRRDR